MRDLKAFQEASSRSESRQLFAGLAVVFMGGEPKEHYPNKKDANGKTIKDSKKRAIKEEVSDGWSYYFSEYGTANKVMVVLPERKELTPLEGYLVTGLGYNMAISSNMLIIDSKVQLKNY